MSTAHIETNNCDLAIDVEAAFYGDPKVKVFLSVRDYSNDGPCVTSLDAHLTRKQARQLQDAISAILSEETA